MQQQRDFFIVESLDDVKHLLEKLELEKHSNAIDRLELKTKQSIDLSMVWQVLSHPYCKIKTLWLAEDHEVHDALVASQVMKQVRRWCEEVPATQARSLCFYLGALGTTTSREALDDLVSALQAPNNRVNQLVFNGGSPFLDLCELVLRPALEHPNNEILSLRFSFPDLTALRQPELRQLCKGLASSNNKLKLFGIAKHSLTLDEAVCLIGGLEASPRLESLEWGVADVVRGRNGLYDLGYEDRNVLVNRFVLLLVKPTNTLHSLYLELDELHEEHALLLAKALTNDHCQLNNLRCRVRRNRMHSPVTILHAICCHPKNQLTTLRVHINRTLEIEALENYLADPMCKLEVLDITWCGPATAKTVANLLERSNSSHLRELNIGEQPRTVFQAFTRSLRSRNNKLEALHIWREEDQETQTRHDFYRALRVSNVTWIEDSGYMAALHPFSKALNSPFLMVLHTLLSVKQVPRLGQSSSSCWVKLLPLQDFILGIADTLGWPLNDLRVSSD